MRYIEKEPKLIGSSLLLFFFAQALCVFLYSVPVFRKPCVKQRTLHGAYTSVRFLAVSFKAAVFSTTRIVGEHTLHMLARFYALYHMHLALERQFFRIGVYVLEHGCGGSCFRLGVCIGNVACLRSGLRLRHFRLRVNEMCFVSDNFSSETLLSLLVSPCSCLKGSDYADGTCFSEIARDEFSRLSPCSYIEEVRFSFLSVFAGVTSVNRNGK